MVYAKTGDFIMKSPVLTWNGTAELLGLFTIAYGKRVGWRRQ